MDVAAAPGRAARLLARRRRRRLLPGRRYGWYARKLGATNSLTAVELVIGNGTLVRADATTNPEIFWAVRGGGGSFGVVTALEFRTFDAPG